MNIPEAESFHAEFISESLGLLDRSEHAALDLEKDPGAENVNSLFRMIHTIKGNLGIFPNKRLRAVTHNLETLLDSARESGKVAIDHAWVDLVLNAIDWIREALKDPLSEPPESAELEAALLRGTVGSVRSGDQLKISSSQSKKADTNHQKTPISIPVGTIERLKKEGQTAAVARIDLATTPGTLGDFYRKCNRAAEDGVLLACRALRDAIRPWESGNTLPVVLVFAATSPGPETLEKYGISVRRITIIRQRGAEEITPGSDETGQGRSAVQSDNHQNGNQWKESGGEQLRVPLRLVDSLIHTAGAAVGVRNELMQVIQIHEDPRLQLVASRLGQLVSRLQQEIMRTRLQEVRSLFRRIPRVAHDVSRLSGKEVELSFEGESVELDKNLMDAIGEALIHVVKNAIDHGIESPGDRVAEGKARAGHVRLSAAVRNGNVTLKIEDDGRGLDLPAIKAKAQTQGRLTDSQAANMSDQEASELVFLPGLSTALKVTETSGRGIGMDAVRDVFKRVGGTVTLRSRFKKGTIFEAILPQTVSVVPCISVRTANESFALPQAALKEIVRIKQECISNVGGRLVYDLREHFLAITDLGQVLLRQQQQSRGFLVVLQADEQRFGLLVDEIGAWEELLVKPVGLHLSDLGMYSGCAVMGDGSVTLILDPEGIARFAKIDFEQETIRNVTRQSIAVRDDFYLIFTSGGEQFAISTQFNPRIERLSTDRLDSTMGREIIRYRNTIVPLIRLKSKSGEAHLPAQFILVSDSHTTIALAADSIESLEQGLNGIQTEGFDEDFISGRVILRDKPVMILNIPRLLVRLQESGFREIWDSTPPESSGLLS